MIEVAFKKLDFDSAYNLARELPNLSEVEIAAILGAIEAKGYDGEAIAGFASGVVEHSSVDLGIVADTCGTGGDRAETINVSTAVAIALSTLHPVAKHGNRSVSSKSGSADVLEAMGVKIEMEPDFARKMVDESGFAFLFAPLYHKAFLRVASVRKRLGIRTIFNVIGPLSNPAKPAYQTVGVSGEDLIDPVAEAVELMERRVVVLHGSGMDEVNPSGETKVAIVDGGVDKLTLTPEDFGVERQRIVRCKSPEESAERIRSVFQGTGLEEDRIFIAINFSIAMYSLGFEDLKENVEIFNEKLESGDFARKLEEIICRSMNM
ncbi:anthranilate phosphoribosyltransferase [Archaeoglobus neptunius]|uniref:anthranilate phosphoribosyltransferase n=1 Tax=Archaeoglobus neptunius TaxID=2798580 RepID=UPI00192537BC|nr:anthranilate phosphoribosyltransferase [Archaeoglobus neptunius]